MGNKIRILPCFKAHTIGTSIWADFNKWSKVGGEYIWECYKHLSGIKHDVLCSLPGKLRVISTDDKIPGIYKIFYWTIYSYPLRDNWATAKYDYKIVSEYETGICQIAAYSREIWENS